MDKNLSFFEQKLKDLADKCDPQFETLANASPDKDAA